MTIVRSADLSNLKAKPRTVVQGDQSEGGDCKNSLKFSSLAVMRGDVQFCYEKSCW